jgi:putative acetyltransferase
MKGLQSCRRAGYDAIVVLGHPRYYSRFGFATAQDHGLGNEYRAHEAFMVLALKQRVLGHVKGLVRYAPEFQEAGC